MRAIKDNPVALIILAVILAVVLYSLLVLRGDGPLVNLGKPTMVPAEREIETNEAACAAEERPGYAVYVVTRWGLLRGCLLVPHDADPRDPRGTRFIHRRPPL